MDSKKSPSADHPEDAVDNDNDHLSDTDNDHEMAVAVAQQPQSFFQQPNPTTQSQPTAQAAVPTANKRYRPAPAKTFQCRGYGECRMVFSRSEHLARHIRYVPFSRFSSRDQGLRRPSLSGSL